MDPRQNFDSPEAKDVLYRGKPITVKTIKKSRIFTSLEMNCLESFPDLARMDSSSVSFRVLFNDFFEKYGIRNTGFYNSTEEDDESISKAKRPSVSIPVDKTVGIVAPEFEYGASELSEPNSSTRKTKDCGIVNQGVYLGTEKGLKYYFETKAGKIENYAFPSSDVTVNAQKIEVDLKTGKVRIFLV